MLLIALTIYVLLMFQFLLIAILMVLQSMFLIKTSILVFTIAAGFLMMLGNIKNLLAPKDSSYSDNMHILSSFFIFLLSCNFLRKQKNDPRLKIILISTSFLVCIFYRFSKPQNKLKSCLTCQCFTHDTIERTNEVHTSHFQSELSFFAISKFRFKNDNSFYPSLLLLSGDISLNPWPFSNPQLLKQEEWQAFSNRGLHLK